MRPGARCRLSLAVSKRWGGEEQVERRSSPATMSSQAMASPLGNRGTGRTRFPSVDVLSEFSHSPGHLQTKFGPLIKLVLWSLPPSRADVRPLEPGLALDCQTGHPGGGGVAPGARCAGRDVAGLGVVWRGRPYRVCARPNWPEWMAPERRTTRRTSGRTSIAPSGQAEETSGPYV